MSVIMQVCLRVGVIVTVCAYESIETVSVCGPLCVVV